MEPIAYKQRVCADAGEIAGVLADKFMPGFYRRKMSAALIEKYRSGVDALPVAVYRIRPEHITEKENQVEPAQLFGHNAAR